MGEILLEIGGFQARIRLETPVLEALRPRWRLYEVATGSPLLLLDVEVQPDEVSDYQADIYPPAEARLSGSILDFSGSGFSVHVAMGTPARAICRCAPYPILVDNALRLCLSALAPTNGALLLHASALAWDRGANVFTGPKGSGKSTALALLAADPRVRSLGDEVIVLRIGANEITSHSTPFGWRYDPVGPAAEPVCRILLLAPPSSTFDTPAGRAAYLFRNVLTSAGGQFDEVLLDLVGTLVRRVHCRRMWRPTVAELVRVLSGY